MAFFFVKRHFHFCSDQHRIQLFKTVLKIAEYIEWYNCVATVSKK